MKILIADDEQPIIDLLTTALEKENFTVDTALDGQEAFEKAKSKKYDVIILDIMMPEKSGFDVITSLRTLGIDTPILVISARSMVQDRIFAINVGADDYLVKDFSVEELSARIKSLIRRSAQRSSNVLYCDSLRLNLSDMSVHKGQKPLYLSRKEWNLLLVLLKNKGKVVRRQELVESIWDKKKDEVNSNTLDVHVRFLREKIDGPISQKSMIRTFRGVGYMLQSSKR